jgi:hypothetical protein
MHAVKGGMMKSDVQRLLGKPDDLDRLPRAPGIDWIFVYPDGSAVVHFNGHGRVVTVEDCPRDMCTLLVPTKH